jgi:hypothetical protein
MHRPVPGDGRYPKATDAGDGAATLGGSCCPSTITPIQIALRLPARRAYSSERQRDPPFPKPPQQSFRKPSVKSVQFSRRSDLSPLRSGSGLPSSSARAVSTALRLKFGCGPVFAPRLLDFGSALSPLPPPPVHRSVNKPQPAQAGVCSFQQGIPFIRVRIHGDGRYPNTTGGGDAAATKR